MPLQDLFVGSSSRPAARSPTDFQYPTVTVSGPPVVKSPTDFQYSTRPRTRPTSSGGGGLFGVLSTVARNIATVATGGDTGLSSNRNNGSQPSQTPVVSTAQVDGQSGFVNGLSDNIRGVLDSIGAVGDFASQFIPEDGGSAAPRVQTVGYRGTDGSIGLNPLVIGAVLVAAGGIYLATKD